MVRDYLPKQAPDYRHTNTSTWTGNTHVLPHISPRPALKAQVQVVLVDGQTDGHYQMYYLPASL